MPLILFWPFYIDSHNVIFSQFASKHKTSVTFFLVPFQIPECSRSLSLSIASTEPAQDLVKTSHVMQTGL